MIQKSLILMAGLMMTMAWAEESATSASEKEKQRTLRGKIVEIHAELQKSHRIDIPGEVEPIYGFKTSEGEIYTLLKTRRSLALFEDPRLQERELILKGRQFPKTKIFEATFIQSVHDGKIHDVYYYCDICAIKTLTPEICSCCREPVRLVEEPLNFEP